MCPRADKVKIGYSIIAVVRAHIGGLPQHRFKAERAAQMRRKVAAEIGGGVMKLRHNP